MKLDNLDLYDEIVMWGGGEECIRTFHDQFPVSCIIDQDHSKKGLQIGRHSVINADDYIPGDGKLLFVIASSQFYQEIYKEICSRYPKADVISLNEMIYIFDQRNKSFCLWGIDAIVNDILSRAGFSWRELSYIEVGANHPFRGNATASMYLRGAKGILIEPNPDIIASLKKLRPRDIVLNLGISNQQKIMKFYRMDNSYRSTFDYEVVKQNIKKGFRVIDKMDIPVDTLDHIIDHSDINTEKAYLSIATMGNEGKVLEGFHYQNYHFPVISVGYSCEEVKQAGLFVDYKVIASVPKHLILVNDWVYKKING